MVALDLLGTIFCKIMYSAIINLFFRYSIANYVKTEVVNSAKLYKTLVCTVLPITSILLQVYVSLCIAGDITKFTCKFIF